MRSSHHQNCFKEALQNRDIDVKEAMTHRHVTTSLKCQFLQKLEIYSVLYALTLKYFKGCRLLQAEVFSLFLLLCHSSQTMYITTCILFKRFSLLNLRRRNLTVFWPFFAAKSLGNLVASVGYIKCSFCQRSLPLSTDSEGCCSVICSVIDNFI